MGRKRILYCEGNMDSSVGGSYYSLFYLVESLDKALYEPVIVFHRRNRLIPMYRQAGLDTRIFPYRKALHIEGLGQRPRLVGRPVQLLLNVANLFRMIVLPGLRCARYLAANRIDLVHLNNTIVRNHHWMLGARLAGVRCISHERGINKGVSRFARFFAKGLAAIICISGSVKNNLVSQGVDPEKLFVVHNGLDPARIRPDVPSGEIRKRYGIEEHAPVIGIVGNIKAWKGQDVVVRATARLRDRWPELRCLLVGDLEVDPQYEEQVHALVRELGLEDNVIFTGYQSNIANTLNVMDIMIHASVLPEPFGRVLLEAMAMKKPVVGARDGAIPEIVVEGETGFMFAPGDDAELASKVAILLDDRQCASRLGEQGYLRAVQEFGIRKNVDKTQQLYQQLFTGDDGVRSAPLSL